MTLGGIIGLIGLLFGADLQKQPVASTPWPTHQWSRAFFSDMGIDDSGMTTFSQKLNSSPYGHVNHVLLIKEGHIIFDQRFEHDYQALHRNQDQSTPYFDTQRYPYLVDYSGVYTDEEDPADPYYDASRFNYYLDQNVHTLQAITKGVTTALIGMAIARGELQGLDQTLLEMLPGQVERISNMGKGEVTLEDLLTTRSGLDGTEHLLSAIMQQATGMQIDEYAAIHLFRPLGITHTYWQRTPIGLPDTENGLYLTPYDLAKIGLLYLRGGQWEDQQLIPKSWIDAATKPTATDTGPSSDGRPRAYGYHWWLLPYGPEQNHTYAITGLGYGDQRMFLLPEYDLVAVFMSWNIDGKGDLPVRILYDLVLPLVE